MTAESPFKPVSVEYPTTLWRPRPPADGARMIQFGPDNDQFEVFIEAAVFKFISDEMKAWSPDETIGILGGRVCKDDRGPYTLVLAAVAATRDEAKVSPGHVRLGGEFDAALRRRLEVSFPALEVVGWYHSHPRFRALFSEPDRMNQRTWSNPNHLGIVVSGLEGSEKFGVYRGPEATKLQRSPSPPIRVQGLRGEAAQVTETTPIMTDSEPAGSHLHGSRTESVPDAIGRARTWPLYFAAIASSLLLGLLLGGVVFGRWALVSRDTFPNPETYREDILRRTEAPVATTTAITVDPTIRIACTPSYGPIPLTVSCTVKPPQEHVNEWLWHLDEARMERDSIITHVFRREGTYSVTVIGVTEHRLVSKTLADFIVATKPSTSASSTAPTPATPTTPKVVPRSTPRARRRVPSATTRVPQPDSAVPKDRPAPPQRADSQSNTATEQRDSTHPPDK